MSQAQYQALADRIARKHGIDPDLFRKLAFSRPTVAAPRAPRTNAPHPARGGADPFDALLRRITPAHVANARKVLAPAGMVALDTTSTHDLVADWVMRETGGRGNDNLYQPSARVIR